MIYENMNMVWDKVEFVRIPDENGNGSASGVKFTFTDENGTVTEVVLYSGQAYRMAQAFIAQSDNR